MALLPCHSTGLASQWVGLTGRGFLGFIMRAYEGRLWQACGVSGSIRKEEKLPSPAAPPGEGEKGTVSFNTTLFCIFFLT
jgi:hypothetical protein